MPTPYLSLLIHISIRAERQRAGEQNHALMTARALWNSRERHSDLWQTKEPKSTRIPPWRRPEGLPSSCLWQRGCLSWGWTFEVHFFSEIGHSANIFFLFYNSWRMLPICHPMPKKAKQCFPSICRTSDGVQWDNLPAQINRHHTFQDWSLQKSSCSTTTEIYEDWEGILTALLLLF